VFLQSAPIWLERSFLLIETCLSEGAMGSPLLATMAAEIAIDALHSFVEENENGASELSRGAPFLFCNREEN
jgi:hypothetical protein